MSIAPGIASNDGFVAYVTQRFPALRTTFIRRDIEGLRHHDVPLRLVSIRPVDRADIAGETEAESLQRETMYLPRSPLDLESLVANVWALGRHPWKILRCWSWAFGDAGGPGLAWRARLWLQIWRGPLLARRMLKQKGCRHVHAQFADGAATTALVASRLLGVGFSFTSHTSYDSQLLSEKLRLAEFVASISKYDRRKLIAKGGPGVADRIHVIHCGIPLVEWRFREPRDVGSPLRILSVGALIEKKGHDTLIRACRLLKDAGMVFECRIVGSGPLLDSLSRLIRDLGLESMVTLVGPLPQEAVRSELSRSDVFVLASRTTASGDTDGIPVSLMEAMAFGLGVVSTLVAGIPELITHGDTGFIGAEGDAHALAGNIALAAVDGPQRRRRIAQARKKIEDDFDVTKESEKHAVLLKALIR